MRAVIFRRRLSWSGFGGAKLGSAKLGSARRGSVSLVVAVTLPIMAGMAGLGAEYSYGVMTQVENQRAADLPAYSGALAYNAKGTTAAMNAAVSNAVTLNGLSSASAVGTLVTSPSGDGNSAVKVSVTTNVPLVMSRLINGAKELTVNSTAYAEVKPPAACVIALSATGAGLKLSGGATLSAPLCAVASAVTALVPAGTSLTTKAVITAVSPSVSDMTNIHPAAVSYVHQTPSDPVSGNSVVTAAAATLANVLSLTSAVLPPVSIPTAPNPTGFLSITLGNLLSVNLGNGCLGVGLGNLLIVTCPFATSVSFGDLNLNGATLSLATNAGTTYNFNSITNGAVSLGAGTFKIAGNVSLGGTSSFGSGNYSIGGNLTVSYGTTTFTGGTLNVKGGISTAGNTSFGAGTYNVGADISTAGTTIFGTGSLNVAGKLNLTGATNFGAGTYNVAKGIVTGGGSNTSFGAGTFKIGQGTGSCGGDLYSICHAGSSLSFAGPSTFTLSSGIYNAGGSTLTLGSGTGNSFQIGKSPLGNAIYNGGGGTLNFADASGAGKLFQLVGNLTAGGGSCTTMPPAIEHDINGSISSAGGLIMGAGIYAISGYFALGENGGGAVYCAGSNVGLTANGVTMQIAGKVLSSTGSCAGRAFCIVAGFSNVLLSAPGLGTTTGFVLIGPSDNSGGALFGEGANSTSLAGMVYFPKGPITLAGGANLGNLTAQCMELIGSEVTMSGGTTSATSCVGLAGASTSSSTVALVD